MGDLEILQNRIGIKFKDNSLLQQAFVHTSYTSENPEYTISNNERLEFLGDSVLNFVTAEKIYSQFPDFSEGKLTEIRISLIREETLALLSTELDLGKYLLLGKGEEATGGRNRQTNLADAFEALIGAIFIDQGLDCARDFILKQQILCIAFNGNGLISKNYKAILQEFSQASRKILPEYHLINISGPDHDRIFTVEVSLENQVLGIGTGKTKKAAEMAAAYAGCQKLIPG